LEVAGNGVVTVEPGYTPIMSIPGTPRLVPVAGGEHAVADPLPEALALEVGITRLGDPVVAEAIVEDSGRVTLRGVPETVVVDGGPVTETVLVHGNRISLPQGDVVFQAELEHDDGGRQGGEELRTRGAADIDDPDRFGVR
jgi:hypothetical protein